MKFTKMNGIGNDYVYVNCLEETVDNPSEFAVFVSNRNFGIGSDGLILIKESEVADFKMDMYNADGSRSEMCGNGIRCVGKYVYDYGLTDKSQITIETLAGIKHLNLITRDSKVEKVRVNMGSPELKTSQIPAIFYKDRIIKEPIKVGNDEYDITCVSMGNPHGVTFIDDINNLKIETVGPEFEYHEMFPNRINAEFARVIDKHNIEMRVWERGSGETLACGTGACATVVAAVLNGLTAEQVTVKLLGGELLIEWDRTENMVYMTGTATTVFDGELYV